MSRIRLGGIKVVENRSYLHSSCRMEVDPLWRICSILAAGGTNMGLLTHVADDGLGEAITAASAKTPLCFSAYLLYAAGSKTCNTADVDSHVTRISVFPHELRPEITASLLNTLEIAAIKPRVIASSPSAVTVVVSSADFETAMERLFVVFAFPACDSFSQWAAVCRMDEQQLSEVRCSYNEEVITVYGISHQTGLDLWSALLPVECVNSFGNFLLELGELGCKLPFLISHFPPGALVFHTSFALEAERRELADRAFKLYLPARNHRCFGPASAIFLHGPHFGDRYGIADAFVSALRGGNIPILALSCAVSSISAVIAGNDLYKAIEALNTRFQTPAGNKQINRL